jgi:predicted DNA binding CopG/RHH family protein
LAQAIGDKERQFMKKKIKYTDGPIGKVKIVKNFLPPPHELIFREDTVKVTMALSKNCVEFFKEQAKRLHQPYQTMIRNLLDLYVAKNS